MKVSCPSCQTNYNIDDKRIPPGGAKLKCARCQNTFPIKPDEPVSAPAPAPAPQAASAAIPLPGVAAPQPAAPFGGYDDPYASNPPEEESTRVMSIPVPGAAYRDQGDHEEPTSVAIPLPGVAAPIGYGEPEETTRQFIPLPGASSAPVSDPYATAPQAEDPYAAAPQDDPFAAYPQAEDSYAAAPQAEDPFAAYPQAEDPYALPPQAEDPYAADPQAEDPYALPPQAEDPYAAYPQAEDPYAAAPQDDPFALPPPPSADPYAAAPQDDPFALPPPPSADPYATGPQDDPFALPPPPSADPYATGPQDDPFALPPPPAEDPFAAVAQDDPFALPPLPSAAPNPAADFGDVDFGAPAASVPDSLEFDPSVPARPAGDDLEADFSASLPPLPDAGQADGLEMLSFIDDAAKDNAARGKATSARRFHIRRRSGKVFGPFEDDVVVKMLADGQLLGNEDVSHDSESWMPIGTVPTFAAAIQKLMEGPAGPAAAPARPSGESSSQAAPASGRSMERIQQLYEGRMAAVAVVDGGEKFEKLRKRLPLLITAAAVLLVLGVGFSFSFTRYGAFGLKKFFPAKVKQGSAAHTTLETARKELLQDSFQSYTQAKTLSAQVLASTEYPEVRALWCQAVFYLQRRYAAASGAELSRCRAERPNLELLGEKNVEFIKFLAGEALVSRQPDAVISRLQGSLSREASQGDSEVAFLLAEAYALKKQNEQAVEMLKRVLEKHPESAKAHHALGNLYQATGKADEAAQAYEAALQADPNRVISAVELAAVELLLRKDAQKGLEAAERALDEKLRAEMGPAEIARVRTLKGIALFQLFKPRQAEEELRAALEQEPGSIFTKGYLARVLRSQRQFSAALPFYKEAATAEPQNLEYTDGYINALVATGNMEEALKVVEDASGRFPGDARIAFLFGRIDDARDNFSSAESHYKSALSSNPELFEANVYLGRLYLRQRRNPDAKAQFEQAASKAPRNASVRAGLGELALAENDRLLAQEEFARAVEYDPTLAEVHLGLSRLALLSGDLAQAEKEADTALELDPHMLKDGRLQRGIVLWRLGKLDEAIAELEKAKLEDPRSVNIPITLGAVLLEKGQHKEAEANLLLALTRAPSNPEAHFHMAQVKAARAEFTQALDSMKNAVDGSPKRADYRYAFGNLHRDAKRPADAIEQWKKAVELEPRMADAHESLGQAYLERSEFDNAIASFQAALEADPARTRVLALIGDVHFTSMRWREAIRSYELALKKDPSLTYIFYKVGRCYTEQLLHTQAISWYQKANKAEPDNALPWYHLGFAYKEKGRRKEAVKAFMEYLARTPEAVDRTEIEDEISFLE